MEEAVDQRDQAVDELHTIPVSEDVVVDSSSSDPKELDIDGSSSIPVDEDLVGVVAGFKVKANAGVRAYSKIDIRTGCGACFQFDVGEDGLCTVTKHVKVHNHELCAVDKSHLLRSHRNVGDNQLLYLKDLKKSGVAMADGIRFLKHQAGGSPLIGFTNRDAYNSNASDTSKCLDGTDSNSLIEIFRKRQSTESDFFFDFEVDCDSRLCSFFWRDGRMRQDYELFGDLIESFVWLFRAFLRSMNGKCPQSHGCCYLSGVSNITSSSLHMTYWLVTDYKCHKNSWIQKMYDYREKWCPAFNKDYFSGGILSSQRSETTNHSISRRLSKTAGLCDFYSSFVSVIFEWRSKENGEDFRCAQGVPTMMMKHVKLLLHARDVYTIEIYFLFEEQFMKGNACHQEMVLNDGCQFKWTKKVADGRDVNTSPMFYRAGVSPSIWAVEICRKFQRLIVSSQDNSVTRQFCDEAVEDAKKKVEVEIGYVHIEECGVSSSSGVIQNPSNRRSKGERNVRRSSVIEKKYSVARGRRSVANKVASSTKGVVQSLVLEIISEIAGDGYLVHPSSGSSEFCQFSNDLDDNAVVDWDWG
ncbi:PREDICTED: protein FAR1-RELATED SEQUENCE 5-like [Ipomoea nil]|uniref:protein FAR1-RELATED SEQUENCE 5-like n=1 Tax=Ipomoea nil TaxID=35883 RepID=UPI0009011EEA|nr:PREDICTED: protein FAR1-RELATED SEQUENCE 5-like [Ipomoea nil]